MNRNYFLNSIGYTLFELMVVMVIVGFIAAIGVNTFNNYNRYQTFRQDLANFVQALNLAKSNAYSQVAPSGPPCNSNPLTDYRIRLNKTKYTLYADCGATQNTINAGTKSFSTNVFPAAAPPIDIIFNLLSGTVTGSGTYTFTENGYTKSVTISPVGVINVN